jgi:hypothetical protein
MMTHKTVPPTMMAVRVLRSRVGANSRLNHAKEANGSIAGVAGLALIALI